MFDAVDRLTNPKPRARHTVPKFKAVDGG